MIVIFTAIAGLDDDDRAFMLNLFKNYYSLARKTIFSIPRETKDIEDLINDSFVKLIDKIPLIRTLDCCKTTSYVVYTIRSVAINYIKHRKVENKHLYYSDDSDIANSPFIFEDDSDTRLIRKEEIDLLRDAISMLPEKEKDLLYFKYILEMKDDAIAEILGIAPGSVRQYLTRARRNAKKLMGKETINHAK